MSTLSRICLGLAVLPRGDRRRLRAHEPRARRDDGLLVSAVTFCFLGIVLRLVGAREAEGQPEEEAEIQVAPTIWPFAFAISGVILAVGLDRQPVDRDRRRARLRRSRRRVGSATSLARTQAEAP